MVSQAVSREGVVVDATASAAPRFIGGLAVVLPLGLLVQALVYHSYYRQPVIPLLVWLGMLAGAAWLVPRACTRDHLTTAESLGAVAIAVVAVTAIGLDRKVAGAPGAPDWTILGTVWLLALVAVTSPPKVWVPGSALVAGVHAVFVVRVLGASPLGLSRLAASAYALCSVLTTFAAFRPELVLHGGALTAVDLCETEVDTASQRPRGIRSAVVRTARKLFDGTVFPRRSR